ncbi:MAG: hypothetical protein H6719_22420 [Sandaracinaceae bacterium]|nr:hypothetical protein [Sandaracinaceae bacterium]
MKLKHVALRFAACLVLLLGDRLFAVLALETNAAGALLSPSGAVDGSAFAIALGFLGCRLLFVLVFCGAVAWTAYDAVAPLSSRART